MSKRIDLDNEFRRILKTTNVYYQPPESLKIKYPAIVYHRDKIQSIKADDTSYLSSTRYQVTLIDKNPDSVYIDELLKLSYCQHDRHFVADNLNHDVFTIYI